MAGKKRYDEFARYPKYKEMYIRAFGRMLAKMREKGIETDWESSEDVFNWWMGEDYRQCRIDFDAYDEEEE